METLKLERTITMQTFNHGELPCVLWIGNSEEESPSYSTGRYWYKLKHSTIFIRLFEKPSWLKRFCVEYFMGVKFIDTLETKDSNA